MYHRGSDSDSVSASVSVSVSVSVSDSDSDSDSDSGSGSGSAKARGRRLRRLCGVSDCGSEAEARRGDLDSAGGCSDFSLAVFELSNGRVEGPGVEWEKERVGH